jgi:phenylalanine-4-hydroxylase
MSETLERVPAHLRQFVATQDYSAYDEIDQAVWRFILLQTHDRLIETAHPTYAAGLGACGLSVARIPRIEEIDAHLARFGWGAVCVDGFIPPRAFQEFQALRILTIAGAIRTQEHLAYTPAPDIVHEAAGHAPILPDPEYRAFLERFGEVGQRAFSSPHDRALHACIHRLSVVKEDPLATPAQRAAAERALEDLLAAAPPPSEAALLSRLHWWTVEYGLVGTPRDYKIYGAGLLSSLGEGEACRDPQVRKLALSDACVESDYDITRPQPQLFVARDFAQLSEVLDAVAARFAQRRGGAFALETARASGEVATLALASGACATGIIASAASAWVELSGPAALSFAGKHLAGCAPRDLAGGLALPLGRLASGADPARLDASALVRLGARCAPDELALEFASGVRIEGRLRDTLRAPDGRVLAVVLGDRATASLGERALALPSSVIPLAGEVLSASAGAADPAYWPTSELPTKRTPPPRVRPAADHQLVALYREALRLWERPESPELVPGFTRIARELRALYPGDWLLRWNLLESLRKIDAGVLLATMLRDDLLTVAAGVPGDAATKAPIERGLRYLGFELPHAPASLGSDATNSPRAARASVPNPDRGAAR